MFSLRKMIPVHTHASGSASAGMRMNGESTAAADEPQPGMPEAMYGFQWNAGQSYFASDMSVKYAVGGSLSSEFCTSAGRTVAHGSKLEKTSFGDGTRPMNSTGKKKTKCHTPSAISAMRCLRTKRTKSNDTIPHAQTAPHRRRGGPRDRRAGQGGPAIRGRRPARAHRG